MVEFEKYPVEALQVSENYPKEIYLENAVMGEAPEQFKT